MFEDDEGGILLFGAGNILLFREGRRKILLFGVGYGI